MFLQVLADRQPVIDADPGAEKYRGRMDRSGAQHDLAAFDRFTARRPDADGSAAIEQHPVDVNITPNDQVGAGAAGFKVGVIGRDPPAVAPGERPPADSRCIGRVVIVAFGVAELSERGAYGLVDWCQLIKGQPGQWDRPPFPVQLVAAVVDVVLDRTEGGQHLGPAPAVPTQLITPTLVVIGRPSNAGHGVHRRRSPDPAAPPVERLRLPHGTAGNETRPQPTRFLVGLEPVASTNARRRVRRGVVRTGFHQQDRCPRSL